MPDANQLGGPQPVDSLTLTLGKFSVGDIFDTNAYAHDPRGDFLNWALIDAGAFDYAADAWGYSYGAALEWAQSWWTARAGVFDLSRVPNSRELQRGFGQFALIGELEERHTLWGRDGKLKLLAYMNRGRMADYDQALARRAAAPLPLAQHTQTPPRPDKWKRHQAPIEAVLPGLQELWDALRR